MIAGDNILDYSRLVQIVAEGWGTFFCIIAIIVIWQTRQIDKKKTYRLINFIITEGILLFSDVLSIAFRGYMGTEAFYIVKIANALVFIMGYLVIISGGTYFASIIEHRTLVSIKNWKNIEFSISTIGIALIFINAFYPFLYDFDKNNRYYRLPGNWIITFTYILGILMILALLLNFFKDLKRLEKFAICSALIFPILSLILQLCNPIYMYICNAYLCISYDGLYCYDCRERKNS